jgi:transcriptional regulator GlxA family with amidase domain
MKRRDFFALSSAMGAAAALPGLAHAGRGAAPGAAPLVAPASGSILVAVLLSAGADVIDFAGPWEVFENVSVSGRQGAPVFRPYTVAETTAPIKAGGALTIIPEYTFATAPAPQVIVIPAQGEPSDAMLAWIQQAAQTADLTMSVCTGAFLLARTGLLSGKAATTHHSAYTEFQMAYPDVLLKRGARYVEVDKVASAGGLSSGIDLALRVVERYFGRSVALNTADHLEYQGQGWLNPESNMVYAKRRKSTEQRPLCIVCEMDVARASAPSSAYRGRTYYFCMNSHKQLFDASPERFLAGGA